MAESFVNVTEGSGKKLHSWSRTIGANMVEDELVLHGLSYYASYTAGGVLVSCATAASHLLQLMAGASLNVYITRIRVYQGGAATTATLGIINIHRLTTAGTGGGAVTPSPLDTSDAASGATAMTLPTVKGTEAAALHLGAHAFMQTTPVAGGDLTLFDWDCDRLKVKPWRIPAGVANGIAVKMVSGIAAATAQVNVEFFEANH